MSQEKEQVLRKMVGKVVASYESNTYVNIGKKFNLRVDTKAFGLDAGSLPAEDATFELELDPNVRLKQTVSKTTGEVGHVIVSPTFKVLTAPKEEKAISLDDVPEVEAKVQQPAAPEASDDTDTDIPF